MRKIVQNYCVMTETLMKEYTNFRERNFVDRVKCTVKAGNGGKGCVTYYRDRKVRTGAPDGGSGGDGGNVYFKAIESLYDLNHMKRPSFDGNRGRSGMKSKKDGKCGGDIKLSVPVGTLIYEITGIVEQEQKKNKYSSFKKELLADLDYEGKDVLVARGGRGSKGNGFSIGLKESQAGGIGQTREIYLELKVLADVGLVGYPNAGKSTFLASVTRALPKIADYPFTTLNPMIGKVCFIDKFDFTIADIPGIIDDAHKDKGLGLDFLRHIERTKMLVYMIDISQEGYKTIQILQNEIRHYNSKILDKPYIVIANKCDLDGDSNQKFEQLQREVGDHKCYLISSKHGFNVGQVLMECKSIVKTIRDEEQLEQKAKQVAEQSLLLRRQLLEKELFT